MLTDVALGTIGITSSQHALALHDHIDQIVVAVVALAHHELAGALVQRAPVGQNRVPVGRRRQTAEAKLVLHRLQAARRKQALAPVARAFDHLLGRPAPPAPRGAACRLSPPSQRRHGGDCSRRRCAGSSHCGSEIVSERSVRRDIASVIACHRRPPTSSRCGRGRLLGERLNQQLARAGAVAPRQRQRHASTARRRWCLSPSRRPARPACLRDPADPPPRRLAGRRRRHKLGLVVRRLVFVGRAMLAVAMLARIAPAAAAAAAVAAAAPTVAAAETTAVAVAQPVVVASPRVAAAAPTVAAALPRAAAAGTLVAAAARLSATAAAGSRRSSAAV
jgi:hypothetical protein